MDQDRRDHRGHVDGHRAGIPPDVTLPDLLLALACLMSRFSPQPKKGKKPKAKRKPLPRRGPFRPKDNALKTYRQPSPWIQAIARGRRAERLASPTEAENRFQEILRDMGFVEGRDYERESICFYPGSFCLFDYYFKNRRVAFELDGSAHDDRGQHAHDEGRDHYFARQGIKTVRLRNRVVLGKSDLCRSIILAELASVPSG